MLSLADMNVKFCWFFFLSVFSILLQQTIEYPRVVLLAVYAQDFYVEIVAAAAATIVRPPRSKRAII